MPRRPVRSCPVDWLTQSTLAAPHQQTKPAAKFFGMTVDEHIQLLRSAPKGTMVQLEGGAPPPSASEPAECVAAAMHAAQTAHHVAAGTSDLNAHTSGDDDHDRTDVSNDDSHGSGREQSPAQAVADDGHAANSAHQHVPSSGDSFRTAPSQLELGASPQPPTLPPSPALLPTAPGQRDSRRIRHRESRPNYEDYIDSSLSQPPESDDDSVDFGTSRRRQRMGSNRSSARHSSGDAKRCSNGRGAQCASAKQNRKGSTNQALDAADPEASAHKHAAMDGGDDSANEAGNQPAAKASGAGARKRPRGRASVGQMQQPARRSNKRARASTPSNAAAAAVAAAAASPVQESAAAEAQAVADEYAAEESVPSIPGNSTGAGVQAPASKAEPAEPEAATEAAAAPDAVEAQVASKSEEGSQAAEALAAKDGQLAEQAEAKAARRAQRKADKSAKQAAKRSARQVNCGSRPASEADKQGQGKEKGPVKVAAAAAAPQLQETKHRLSAAPQRDTGFGAADEKAQTGIPMNEYELPSPSSSGSGASQSHPTSTLLASLSKQIGPAKRPIPAYKLMQEGQSRPASIVRNFDSPVAAPGSGKAAGSSHAARSGGGAAFRSPLVGSVPAVKHSSGSRKQSSGQHGSTPQQRPGSQFKLAGLSRMPIKPLHPQLHKRTSA